MHTHRAPIHLLFCVASAMVVLLSYGCTGPLSHEGPPAPKGNPGAPYFGGFSSQGGSNIFDAGGPESDTATESQNPGNPTEPPVDEKDPFDYPCDPGEIEPCYTSCGTQGVRQCLKDWGPCIVEETCNGIDDNCDGQVDEGLVNACGSCGPVPAEICNGFDDNCDGQVDEGLLNACGNCGPVPLETCNGFDDNCDGQVDEGLLNACGNCGPLPQEVCNGVDDNCDGQVDEGLVNACGGCGPLSEEIPCNGIDDDCDGTVDAFTYNMNLSGDCLLVECPPEAPYPVGCDLNFAGGDHRGCVASQPNVSLLYLQEGNQCGAGSVSGSVTCSCQPGTGLNEQNCPINKPQKLYVSQPFQCPD